MPLQKNIMPLTMFPLIQKAFLKLIAIDPRLDRLVRYRNPRKYWQERGGEKYFGEQEAVFNRHRRSEFIGEEINRLSYQSLLEIGCGYGKQLKNFLGRGARLVGCDFSAPQLKKAREYCADAGLKLVEADGSELPFGNHLFDVVLSSAVILHNEYPKAQRIISEMIRVGRKYLIHNEDTDVTFSRYGYDMKKTYEKMNFKVLASMPIPVATDPAITQFTIVELPSSSLSISPQDVPLQYH